MIRRVTALRNDGRYAYLQRLLIKGLEHALRYAVSNFLLGFRRHVRDRVPDVDQGLANAIRTRRRITDHFAKRMVGINSDPGVGVTSKSE